MRKIIASVTLAIALASAIAPSAPLAAAQTTTKRVVISSGVAQSLLIQKVNPVYPPEAKAAKVSGTVVLRIEIDTTGTVQNPQVVSGNSMLQQSSLDAVKQWRYRPYTLNGQPVYVETTVNVVYSLAN
jgi:periplasmic protein TonB